MVGRVALLAFVTASCGRNADPVIPERVPSPPPPEVDAPPQVDEPPQARNVGPRYLVGETCVSAALHGPHLFPLFAGGDIGWTADESVARAPLTEASQRFNFLGFDGELHGHIVTAMDGRPSDPRGFVGKYYGIGGVGPCSYRLPDGTRGSWVDCGAAGGCGIAVAIAGHIEPPPAPPAVEVTQLCVTEGLLVGDLDGDGAAESFPLEGFRGQTAVEGAPYAGVACAQPRFAWYRRPLGGDVLDVLGAADLDHDGHLELMVAYTPAGGQRTVALYAPTPAPVRRLDLRATVAR